VAEAGDGQEAVICFEEIHPDVILMDLLMPGMEPTTTFFVELIHQTSYIISIEGHPHRAALLLC
jgi:CheY-like chemotaxis protein